MITIHKVWEFSFYQFNVWLKMAVDFITGYDDKKGGPVSGKDDLNCDFDSPCCWDNEPIPFDQFDWKSVEGQTDNELMKKNFLGVKPPSTDFCITQKLCLKNSIN